MADKCTCGTLTYPDALFCHKCGRPLRELMSEAAAEPAPPVSPQPVALPAQVSVRPAAPVAISFHNRLAVKIGLLTSILATILISFPLPTFVQFFWVILCMTVAGFVAVYIYHRRSGEFLSVTAGARMGWITGMFSFAIALVPLAITAFALSREGKLSTLWRDQIRAQSSPGPQLEEAMRLLESPLGVAAVLLVMLIASFVVFTILPTIGGALGAKVLEKE